MILSHTEITLEERNLGALIQRKRRQHLLGLTVVVTGGLFFRHVINEFVSCCTLYLVCNFLFNLTFCCKVPSISIVQLQGKAQDSWDYRRIKELPN